ncbi:MAG: hypothetical protein OXN15_07845 [Chloroflexota bacterium]|nr:hypothetical protein [Chloroflexota bacterium]MDE2968932.1 hypothetical protein [Chloroflexota bacterium]
MVNAARVLLIAVALAVLLAVACNGSGDPEPAAPAPAPSEAAQDPAASGASGDGGPELNGILATKDLGVGENRVSFLLTSPRALIKVPSATVTSVNLSVPDTTVETATAEFFLWPFGSRGNYVTDMTFDRPGEWRLDVEVTEEDGSVSRAEIPLTIAARSHTPSFGDAPPSAGNKTARDVGTLAELTTDSTPDPDLYAQTIEEALGEERPLVLVFASPALCTSPTCGPQVDTVAELKEQYKGQAGFIHVEVYDNPADIQGDLDRAQYSPLVEEWGLSAQTGYLNESWVFIFDAAGALTSKYQGYASIDELTKGLEAVL